MQTRLSLYSFCSFIVLTVLLGATTGAHANGRSPFRGHAEGAVTSATPVALGVSMQIESQGEATRLGRFTRTEVLLLDPTTNTFAGLIAFTTANGDTVTGLVSGGFVSPTSATGTYWFTGGTGRFAGASGWASFSLSSEDGVNFTVAFKGSIEGAATPARIRQGLREAENGDAASLQSVRGRPCASINCGRSGSASFQCSRSRARVARAAAGSPAAACARASASSCQRERRGVGKAHQEAWASDHRLQLAHSRRGIAAAQVREAPEVAGPQHRIAARPRMASLSRAVRGHFRTGPSRWRPTQGRPAWPRG